MTIILAILGITLVVVGWFLGVCAGIGHGWERYEDADHHLYVSVLSVLGGLAALVGAVVS